MQKGDAIDHRRLRASALADRCGGDAVHVTYP
jgi:hypothetical protein